jgi:hypothetical protein
MYKECCGESLLLNVLPLEPNGKALGQLASLLLVLDDQRIQVLRAADLEFETTLRLLLDGHHLGVLPASRDEELLDLMDLLRLSTH